MYLYLYTLYIFYKIPTTTMATNKGITTREFRNFELHGCLLQLPSMQRNLRNLKISEIISTVFGQFSNI